MFGKKKKEDAPKIYVAPIKEALQRLLELDEKDLLKQNKVKAYYTELTDILRLYLWNRYSIRTLERTSEEILESLRNSYFKDDEAYNELKEIFKFLEKEGKN